MTAAPPPSRLQIAHQLAAHLGHRDFDKVAELLSPEVTYRVEGNHVLAGRFHGPEEVMTHVQEVAERTGDTYDPFKWDDWLVGDQHVAALFRIRAQGHGAVFSAKILVLFGFDSADKVSEIRVFFDDAEGADRFFI